MRKLLLSSVSIVIGVFWAAPSLAQAEKPEDTLIVANKNVGISAVSIEELRAFYLGERKSWKDGKRVVPVHAKRGSELRETFIMRVLGVDSVRDDAYWRDQKIRKGLAAPPAFSHTLKAVFKLKGSIGYVFRKDYREGVTKVLLVVRRRKPAN